MYCFTFDVAPQEENPIICDAEVICFVDFKEIDGAEVVARKIVAEENWNIVSLKEISIAERIWLPWSREDREWNRFRRYARRDGVSFICNFIMEMEAE